MCLTIEVNGRGSAVGEPSLRNHVGPAVIQPPGLSFQLSKVSAKFVPNSTLRWSSLNPTVYTPFAPKPLNYALFTINSSQSALHCHGGLSPVQISSSSAVATLCSISTVVFPPSHFNSVNCPNTNICYARGDQRIYRQGRPQRSFGRRAREQ